MSRTWVQISFNMLCLKKRDARTYQLHLVQQQLPAEAVQILDLDEDLAVLFLVANYRQCGDN